jgi:hypothetical protein
MLLLVITQKKLGWFLFERADILGMDLPNLQSLIEFLRLNVNHLLLNLVVKTEHCSRCILDISHAVRRAMAINSEIKSWG